MFHTAPGPSSRLRTPRKTNTYISSRAALRSRVYDLSSDHMAELKAMPISTSGTQSMASGNG